MQGDTNAGHLTLSVALDYGRQLSYYLRPELTMWAAPFRRLAIKYGTARRSWVSKRWDRDLLRLALALSASGSPGWKATSLYGSSGMPALSLRLVRVGYELRLISILLLPKSTRCCK